MLILFQRNFKPLQENTKITSFFQKVLQLQLTRTEIWSSYSKETNRLLDFILLSPVIVSFGSICCFSWSSTGTSHFKCWWFSFDVGHKVDVRIYIESSIHINRRPWPQRRILAGIVVQRLLLRYSRQLFLLKHLQVQVLKRPLRLFNNALNGVTWGNRPENLPPICRRVKIVIYELHRSNHFPLLVVDHFLTLYYKAELFFKVYVTLEW